MLEAEERYVRDVLLGVGEPSIERSDPPTPTPGSAIVDETVGAIVDAVLDELEGRRGFGVISRIRNDDPEIFAEMHASLCNRVRRGK